MAALPPDMTNGFCKRVLALSELLALPWARYFADCGFSATFEDTLAEGIAVDASAKKWSP